MDVRGLLARPLWVAAAIGGLVLAFFGAHLLFGKVLLGILVVFILVLLVVVVVLVRQLMTMRAAEAIEHTITRQADADIERSLPGKVAEMQDLKAELLAAFAALKKSNVARRAGEGALAQLPWYMVIGPQGSGKSMLVRRSGLHFALSDERRNPRAVRGVGGTRGFEWWLAEEGVLLAMSGRTLSTAEFEDPRDWQTFLDTLRRQRGSRAINGVVVVTPIDRIADADEAGIDALAGQVRERLLDMVARLGVVFPVYLVFTHADRMAGFAEFFGDLAPEERSQPWGATLPLSVGRGDVARVFERELDQLATALAERRLHRAGALPDAVQRARAFVFPLQLEPLRAPLGRFVEGVFLRDGGPDAVPLRGFYFASAGAEGDGAIDRVLRPAASALGLTMAEPAAPATAAGAWFVEDLFTRVVFPDAPLATASSAAVGETARRRRVVWGGAAGVFAVTVLLLSIASCRDWQLIDRTEQAARGAARLTASMQYSDVTLEALRVIDGLRQRVDALDQLRAHRPWRAVFGFHAAGQVRRPLDRLYARRLTDVMLGLAVGHMAQALNGATSAPAPDTFPATFRRYRVWRLLTSDRDKLDPGDAAPVAAELEMAVDPSRGFQRAVDVPEFDRLVAAQGKCVVRQHASLAEVGNPRLQLDEPLARRVAAQLVQTWDPGALYAALIAGVSGPPHPFVEIAGPPDLLEGTNAVPAPFTRTGWEQRVRPTVNWYARQAAQDPLLREGLAAGTDRPAGLAGALRTRYATDYTQAWVAFLQGVRLRPNPGISPMDEAANVLQRVSDTRSQLFTLLRRMQDETRLGSETEPELGAVDQGFEAVHRFFQDVTGGPAAKLPWYRAAWGWVTHGFRKVRAGLGKPDLQNSDFATLYCATAADVNQALQKVKTGGVQLTERVALVTDAPVKLDQQVLQSLFANHPAQACAPALRTVLNEPFQLAVDAVMGSGHRGGGGGGGGGAGVAGLATAFSAELAAPWEHLSHSYPFAPGGPDADPADVAAFFGPGGALWATHQKLLGQILHEDGSPMGGQSAIATPVLVNCVKRAWAIRQALFATGAGPAFAFTVEPEQPETQLPVNWIALDVNGQVVNYNLGHTDVTPMRWPGDKPEAGVTVSANLATPIVTHGPWAINRALDRARRAPLSNGIRATWTLPATGGKVDVTWNLRVSTTANPFDRGLFRFALP
jgi:type VI secretion system protein ImpL